MSSWKRPEHQQFERVTPLEEVDRSDPVALTEAKAQKVRDQWVAIMGTRMLREQLQVYHLLERWRGGGCVHWRGSEVGRPLVVLLHSLWPRLLVVSSHTILMCRNATAERVSTT